MTDRELMQQALDALVRMHSYGDVFRYQNWQANPYEQVSDAVIVLRERLAQPEQEPVAWRFRETKNKQWSISDDGYYISCKRTSGYIIEPLYTTPPQRKPLTEEEIGLLTTDPRFAHIETPTLAEFARAVIAKATGGKE